MNRSKFEATWMSIDGARLGLTAPTWYSPVVKRRCRMSFWFVATRNPWIGTPIFWSIQPASTLPKFPVGTTNSALARSEAVRRSHAWR